MEGRESSVLDLRMEWAEETQGVWRSGGGISEEATLSLSSQPGRESDLMLTTDEGLRAAPAVRCVATGLGELGGNPGFSLPSYFLPWFFELVVLYA